MSKPVPSIATQVERWQKAHGRNHLPWQQTRDPYRVWLSEVMLQQTQVSTVLEYYPRFMARFPDVGALAAASQDDVLALWSGLGYYSRARNLHRCAQQVVSAHGGIFPNSAQLLEKLPGIGRSTAGAIAAFCFSQRVPILDANVRRVLTRVLAFDGDLAVAAKVSELWDLANALLPHENLRESMPRYTQGLMDLGAGVCLARKPLCGQCPLQDQCAALKEGEPERYPIKTRKLVRKAQSWWLLWLRDGADRVWLQRRPSSGIWAGLYCLPVYVEQGSLRSHPLLAHATHMEELPAFLHVLTHRDLHLHTLQAHLELGGSVGDADDGAWFGLDQALALGLPAPIRKLLESY